MSFVNVADGDTFEVGELQDMLEDEDSQRKVFVCIEGKQYAVTSGSYGRYLNGRIQKDLYCELMVSSVPA